MPIHPDQTEISAHQVRATFGEFTSEVHYDHEARREFVRDKVLDKYSVTTPARIPHMYRRDAIKILKKYEKPKPPVLEKPTKQAVSSPVERRALLEGFFKQTELSMREYALKHGRSASFISKAWRLRSDVKWRDAVKKVRNGEWTIDYLVQTLDEGRARNGNHRGVFGEMEIEEKTPRQAQLDLKPAAQHNIADERVRLSKITDPNRQDAIDLAVRALATLERFEEQVDNTLKTAEVLIADMRAEKVRVGLAVKELGDAIELMTIVLPERTHH